MNRTGLGDPEIWRVREREADSQVSSSHTQNKDAGRKIRNCRRRSEVPFGPDELKCLGHLQVEV